MNRSPAAASVGLIGLLVLVSACNAVQITAVRSQANQGGFFIAQDPGTVTFTQLTNATATINLAVDSQLLITFNAVGWVTPLDSGSTFTPPLFMQCQLDGTPIPVGDIDTSVPFLYPINSEGARGEPCCDYDTRAYTWVLDRVPRGSHTITIWGQFGQPGLVKLAQVGDWSLVVVAVTR